MLAYILRQADALHDEGVFNEINGNQAGCI